MEKIKLLELLIDGKVNPQDLTNPTVKALLSGGTLLSMNRTGQTEYFFNSEPISEAKFIELKTLADKLQVSEDFDVKINFDSKTNINQ